MDIEDLIQRFQGPGHTYTYKECNLRGHIWAEPELRWFPYGWHLPWLRRHYFKRCLGCGIGELVSTQHWVWPKFRE